MPTMSYEGDISYIQTPNNDVYRIKSVPMVGASSSVDGEGGSVPKPLAGDQTKFLKGDGSWDDVPTTNLTPESGIDINEDDEITSGFVKINGRSGGYGLHQCSLVACTWVGGLMQPFCTTSGTGNKTPNYNAKFPIGCQIYYHPDSTAFTANTDFTSKMFYTSYDCVSAIYSAVTGTNISLSNSSNNNVYLRVTVSDGYWSPYYKEGYTNEIMVTPNNFTDGNWYIYLGKTIGSNNTTDFQLEDNHPLYFYSADELIPYETYIASQKQDLLTAGANISISNNVISATSILPYWTAFTLFQPSGSYLIGNDNTFETQIQLTSIPSGRYKITLQLHVGWDSGAQALSDNAPLAVSLEYNNTYVLAGTYIVPTTGSPNNQTYTMGALTVYLTGFVLFVGQQTSSDEIKLTVEGLKGMTLGGSQPLFGSNTERVDNNDFVLLEKIGEYTPA